MVVGSSSTRHLLNYSCGDNGTIDLADDMVLGYQVIWEKLFI